MKLWGYSKLIMKPYQIIFNFFIILAVILNGYILKNRNTFHKNQKVYMI
jgi:hypothetical protein